MSIARWHGENLRCFERFSIDLLPGVNWYTGDNATGKTTLLEGLYFTLTGRSFRARDTRDMIQEKKEYSAVHAVFANDLHTIDIVKYRDNTTRAHLDGESMRKWSQVAHIMPVLFVDTHTHRQFSEAVDVRRKWFDWMMFHVEQSYSAHQSDYKKSMEQRMRALKMGEDPSPWEHMMLEHGQWIEKARLKMMDVLQKIWRQQGKKNEDITLSYASGYGDEPMEIMWRKERYDDLRRGYARSGPHRYDILCCYGEKLYSQRLSLGQQKIFITDLMLIASEVVQGETGKNTLWLMDDVASELDENNIQYVLSKLDTMRLQSVITTLHKGGANHTLAVQGIASIER